MIQVTDWVGFAEMNVSDIKFGGFGSVENRVYGFKLGMFGLGLGVLWGFRIKLLSTTPYTSP